MLEYWLMWSNPFTRYFRGGVVRLADLLQFDRYGSKTWSQEGEDRILLRIFETQLKGFYVDIGAHHPRRFSNTFLFYKRGWCGINIDAMPGSMNLFRKERPRDINLEIGVGQDSRQVDYYMFNEPALNGFSKTLSETREKSLAQYRVENVVRLDLAPLSSVLEKYLPEGQEIDFMSIDVEGFDLEVLTSNDWSKFRPRVVLVEILGSSLELLRENEIVKLMESLNYAFYAKCVNTVFFKERGGV